MRIFLTGLVTGLSVGYLTAPRSGKGTRNQLADAAEEQTNGLKDQWRKIAGEGSNLVNTVKSQSGPFASTVNAYAGQAEDKVEKVKRDAGSMTDQATN